MGGLGVALSVPISRSTSGGIGDQRRRNGMRPGRMECPWILSVFVVV